MFRMPGQHPGNMGGAATGSGQEQQKGQPHYASIYRFIGAYLPQLSGCVTHWHCASRERPLRGQAHVAACTQVSLRVGNVRMHDRFLHCQRAGACLPKFVHPEVVVPCNKLVASMGLSARHWAL